MEKWKPTPERIRFRNKIYIRPKGIWNAMIQDFRRAGVSVILKNGAIYVRKPEKGYYYRAFPRKNGTGMFAIKKLEKVI
jgi:hypothetical protein